MSLWDDIKDNFKAGDMLAKLIYVNLGVFLVVVILKAIFVLFVVQSPIVYQFLALPSHFGTLIFKPWTLLTYMFTHEGFLHILFNMIFLYLFGKIFLYFLNEKKLLSTYILGGLAGGVLYLLSYNFFPLFDKAVYGSTMIGASASVMAVMFATVTLVPNHPVLLPFIGPVKLKYIGLLFVLLDIMSIADMENLGGHIAHIGGAIYGFIYIQQYRKGNDHSNWFARVVDSIAGLFRSKQKPRVRVVHKRKLSDEEYNQMKAATQEEIDRILDKIKASGYDSLTKEEKDTLFRASEK